MTEPIDAFAAAQSISRRDAVVHSAALTTEQRSHILRRDYEDPDALRRLAGRIKQHTLDHLDHYLEQAVSTLEKNGVHVHFAPTAEAACRIVLGILQKAGARSVVKSKSMVSEEIHLNDYLARHGITSLETDLGEFIVQIDGDTPSHIVRPIIHKRRDEVARSFEAHGLGAYDDDPETITRRARRHLRRHYLASDAGITGANFLSAESGRLVIVTNEGNARFCMAPNRLHIALLGLEKIVPRDRDLSLFLNLLARSATAQQLTVYTQFIRGPRAPSQPSGPDTMHLVLLDNGRTEILGTSCREILRCIRCGACQNVCPVYRQASGHAYRTVYGGPVGAVLSPLLAGPEFSAYADLPRASTLCGACQEVCPVDIPIPELLLRLRAKGKGAGIIGPDAPPMQAFGAVATSPGLWRLGLKVSKTMNLFPAKWVPWKPLQQWLRLRTLPRWEGGVFRAWMRNRQNGSRRRPSPDPDNKS